MVQWKLADAKNRFSAVVDAAIAGEPQHVTRRGEPAVVVLDAAEYERLCKVEKDNKPTLMEMLMAIPKGGPDDLFERQDWKARDVEF